MPSCSSPSPSSRSEHSIPLLSTSRIFPTFSAAPVAGITVPGGAKIVRSPARAFGAPQTTCTVAASPTSTMQTRNRSRVRVRLGRHDPRRPERHQRRAGVLHALHLERPIAESVSVTRSTEASVSRCERSHDHENFIAQTPSCSDTGLSGLVP